MLDTALVREQLTVLSAMTAEELDAYSAVIETAAAAFDSSDDAAVNNRLVLTAAAKANYLIALAKDGENKITSFKAGDVSFTENGHTAAAALALLQELENTGGDLTSDKGFVFRTV